MTVRASKDDEVKDLDMQINKVKLDILKNSEKLRDAKRYKQFLLSLDPEFAEQQNNERMFALETLKYQWIAKMKNLQPYEAGYKIVFTDDEEIHGEVKLIIKGPGPNQQTSRLRN